MKVYSFSEARQQFAAVLDTAQNDGAVKITHRDGRAFTIQPLKKQASPLAVAGVNLGIDKDEILRTVRESRRA